jgi:hypothetical protein
LHEAIKAYAGGLREARGLAQGAQKHTDDVLTWAIGLMGAGLLALPAFTATACPSSPRQHALLGGVWVVGILLAVAGRVVGRAHSHLDVMLFFRKTHAVERLLLDRAEASDVAVKLLAVMNDEDPELQRKMKISKRLNWWVETAYYSSHGFLAAGVLWVFLRAARCS